MEAGQQRIDNFFRKKQPKKSSSSAVIKEKAETLRSKKDLKA